MMSADIARGDQEALIFKTFFFCSAAVAQTAGLPMPKVVGMSRYLGRRWYLHRDGQPDCPCERCQLLRRWAIAQRRPEAREASREREAMAREDLLMMMLMVMMMMS